MISAGQAGLATSHELSAAGVDHVVLERDRVGSSWGRPVGQLPDQHAELAHPAAGRHPTTTNPTAS
ncbi:MAG: hypothetical protein U0V56_01745 [Actinomycetota bacterium]